MLHAVIMAGGSGTRFWPQSRRSLPKQFQTFTGNHTLIEDAAGRCPPIVPWERIWVVSNEVHADETARQLPMIDRSRILCEPCGRNTAPCIGLAAIQLLAVDPDATMLVMPADHVIQPVAMFQHAVREAESLVAREPYSLILFGVEPTQPNTGFGYIRRGERIIAPAEADESTNREVTTGSSFGPAFRVMSFHEKPNQLTAAHYVASGEYYWNCGIFVWRAQAILDALESLAPEIFKRLVRIRESLNTPESHAVLSAEFPQMPSISIDFAVLEKTDHVCVLEAPFEWDDVGSWHSLARLHGRDGDGNTVIGLGATCDSSGCVIRSTDDHLIATIGVEDLIIVHTPTATLVADKRDESSLKRLIEELEKRGLSEYL